METNHGLQDLTATPDAYLMSPALETLATVRSVRIIRRVTLRMREDCIYCTSDATQAIRSTFASQNPGMEFDLWVRNGAKLSPPLQDTVTSRQTDLSVSTIAK